MDKSLTAEEFKELQKIALKMSTTVEKLLHENKDPKKLIEDYRNGNFRILNE
jgi:hypothetical protein